MHRIVFSGTILPGYDQDRVRGKLLSLLKLGPEQTERLFSGKSHTLKKGLNGEEAKRYQQHLAKIGVGVDIDPPLQAASSSPFPTLIFDLEPETPARGVVPTKPEELAPVQRPPAPAMQPSRPSIGESLAAPVVALAPGPTLVEQVVEAQITCPKCGEVQPKRTLCRACSVDMPRFAAAQRDAALEAQVASHGAAPGRLAAETHSAGAAQSGHSPKMISDSGQIPRITPFWNRLPKFFLFPLQGMNALALVLLSFSSLLAEVFPLPFPFDYLMVQCLILLAGVRRGFMQMDAMSRGYLTAEAQADMTSDPQRVNLPWKLLGVMVVWGVAVNIAASLGEVLGYLVWAFTVVTLPAAVMALSVTKSFASGLNPVLWVRIIRGVGKPYAVLFAFLVLLSGGTNALLPLLAPFLRGWFALPVITFCFLYFLFVMFAMMGYVLYQFHWQFGVHVDRVHSEESSQAQGNPVEDLISSRIAAGDIEGAVEAARENHLAEPEDVKVQQRYHKLLLMADKKDQALEHGKRYLSLLLRKLQGESAVALFRRLREMDPKLSPSPGEILGLAQAAHRCREYEMALALTQSLESMHPRHADIPEARFLAARIQSEAFRRDDAARQILGALCEKFPEHEVVVREAVPYLRALEAIGQSSAV